MRPSFTAILAIALALVSEPLLASTILYRSDAELVRLSARVVHARVVSQRMARGGPAGTIHTVTTLAVLEDFTGQPGDVIEVWELGGVVGDEELYVGGGVKYTIGSDVLVCLERGPYGFRSIAMGFSKFDVAPGSGRLRRNMRDVVVVGGRAPAAERTLDEFRSLAAAVTGHRSRRSLSAAPVVEVTAQDQYTLFQGGWRWVQADSATPVPWYKNTSAAPPVAGTAVSEIQTALSAWTTPPSASITLQYAGTTLQSVAEGPWSGIPNGNGVITFEDPNDEISGLTLAVGGGSANAAPGSGGTIGGIPFLAFLRGYVIFQNAADLPSEFKTSVGFARVLEHEIGHAIGLGHTDDTSPPVADPEANIMNSSCCSPTTPVPPAIGPDDLAGLNFIYPATPTGPAMALDRTTLRFGAVTTGTAFVSQTSAQLVRLTQSGSGTVTWTATSNQPWLQVSPASGTGPASLSVSVVSTAGLPAAGVISGAITLQFVGASNAPGPITTTLALYLNGTSAGPTGVVDTPLDQTTGVTGAVPFTGWALDDVEVTRVMICRAAFGSEVAPLDPNCAGNAQIFVGFAVFIDGARPDVQAAYPMAPLNSRAGWGFMVLTNMLPSQGNGTYVFTMYAQDVEGRTTVLGTRTMTCANATATKPFGAIDTPTQGGVASGAGFVNFGWALTPQPKLIPLDGSTITVVIDGVGVGTASYNHERPDIETLFPGYGNTNGANGAIGLRMIDTTALTNGLHTISWTVVDNAGAIEGIGSRFFTVSNGASALTAATEVAAAANAVRTTTPLVGRRGWDLAAPLEVFEADRRGRIVVRSEEVSRVELHLAAGARGALRTSDGLQPLPPGSTIDDAGVFTWAPGVGFVGTYDLAFVHAGEQRDVRVILQPKGSHLVGAQVVIDAPRSQQDVGQPFAIGGWAADLTAARGTGVAALHVWAYPLTGGPPAFVGAVVPDGLRPDVGAVHGEQFEASGFGLSVDGLAPGHYDVAVFAWSAERRDFVAVRSVRVTVRP